MATLIVTEDLAGPASLGRGGHTMYLLQWLHGLERLGYDVYHLEFLRGDARAQNPAVVRYFAEIVTTWWRPERAALIAEASGESLWGLDTRQVARVADEAAALVTLAAHYRREPYPLVENVRPRILIEQDPGYTHLWAAGGDARDILGEHDLYFTVGANIGTGRSAIPTLGIRWTPIWNPVLTDWWSPWTEVARDCFTTVADWRSYGYLEFEDRILGPKAEEFRKFLELPRLAGEPLELVLNIDPDDPDKGFLEAGGWRLEPPDKVATPELYRDYIRGSLGEFSCVKGGYAGTKGGWFSDRSACYLAAGRPVVLQATGFQDVLPTGAGLFAVTDPEEAAAAIRAIRRDYGRHSAAAVALAEAHFGWARALRPLAREIGTPHA